MNIDSPPPSVESAARCLKQRYGKHIAALMAYGSQVFGGARRGSAYDFWLIVKDPAAFHQDNAEFYRTGLNLKSTPEEQTTLNRVGPLFYALECGDMQIKIGVLGEAELAQLCRDEWWTVKGRMQKPLRMISSTPAVDEALLAARREGLICGLNLAPREFTLDELLTQIVSLSYRAEVRPEAKSAKIAAILEGSGEQLEGIYRPLLQELPYVEERGNTFADHRTEIERHRARTATLHALKRSKWCRQSRSFIWRNFRSHRSPISYLIRKIIGEFEKLCKRLFRKQS
jgi:hypothetical protein